MRQSVRTRETVKIMKIFLIICLIGFVNCQVAIKEGWREVKFPWDSVHFKDVMKKIYPYTPKVLINRNGRIAGEIQEFFFVLNNF